MTATPASQFLQLLNDLVRCGPIREGRCSACISHDSGLIDDERGWAIAEFCVDSHLKGDSVACTHRERRISQHRITQVISAEAAFFEQKFRRPHFVRIDGQKFGVEICEVIERVTQLRELAVADRSGVAIDEHQHHSLFALKLA